MNFATINNCTENGEIFSCFLRIGKVESMTDCENSCRKKNLFPFELDDFYNFAARLNQSDFLKPSIALTSTKNASIEVQNSKFQKGEI